MSWTFRPPPWPTTHQLFVHLPESRSLLPTSAPPPPEPGGPGVSPIDQPLNFVLFCGRSYADGVYLVEITAAAGGAAPPETFWDNVWGEIPWGDLPAGEDAVEAAESTFYYSDRPWTGGPTDADAPNRYYDARVSVPLIQERTIPVLPEEGRRVTFSYGAIEIANGDGALDDLVDGYTITGRRVRVLHGARRRGSFNQIASLYRDFGIIAEAVGEAWATDRSTVRVTIRDQTSRLDVPLQTTLYLGTGGIEGGASLKGKPVPVPLGICRDITPDLVSGLVIYRFADRPVNAVLAAYDKGAALVFNADFANFSALNAASVPAGQYATCLNEGLVKVGIEATRLTLDVEGILFGGSYVNHHAGIAQRIFTDFMGFTGAELELTDFQTVAVLYPGPIGLYISSSETPTAAEVLDRIAGSFAGWWGPRRRGKIGFGQISIPEASIVDGDIFDFIRLERNETRTPPRWRQRVNYQRCYTPQSEPAAALSATRKAFLANQWRTVSASDSDVLMSNRRASDPPPLESLFDETTDAQALANSLLSLHKEPREEFTAVVKRIGFLLEMNNVVKLIDHRFGLGQGRRTVIRGFRERADRSEVDLLVWG